MRSIASAQESRPGPRGNSEETRAAILAAACREFAQGGLAGARTDAIARAAGVNKAMLYYYYGGKDELYGAVLDRAFSGLSQRILEVLQQDLPPREKFLAYVGAHFDYVAAAPAFTRLVQGEMMRSRRGESPHLRRIVERYLRPMFRRIVEVVEGGIRAGVFRNLDPYQFVPSVVAMIVFYFNSSAIYRMLTGVDPFSPQQIARRRAALLDLVAAALLAPGRRNGAGGGAAKPGSRAARGMTRFLKRGRKPMLESRFQSSSRGKQR